MFSFRHLKDKRYGQDKNPVQQWFGDEFIQKTVRKI